MSGGRTHLVEYDGHVTLEFDGAIPGALLALPAPARRYDAETLLFAVSCDSPRLPPLVVARVRHVQNFPIPEGQTSAGQAVVLVGVVVEQGPVNFTTLYNHPSSLYKQCAKNGSTLCCVFRFDIIS